MPYASDDDLPRAVRKHLPPHAREMQTYQGAVGLEEIAHRVAWAAVKRRYRKSGAEWLPRDEDDLQ